MPAHLNGPIIKLDLLKASQLKLAKQLVANPACAYVHFAPPCGKSSRARLIQNGDKHMPPPLRNDQYPNGLPWLTTEQQERVNKANELYQVTCELITLCQQHKILWSCENPGRSFMWQTTPFVSLFHTISCARCATTVTNTNHGGKNLMAPGPLPKKQPTRGPLLELLQHKSFCNCKNKDWCAISPVLPNRNAPCRLCGLPPTFSHVNTCHQWCLNSNKSLIKTLRLRCLRMLGASALPKGGMSRVPKKTKTVTVGVHLSPEEFLKEAIRLCHPTEQNCLFPKEVRTNVSHLSSRSIHQVALDRTEEVKRWVSMAKELSTKERDLKTSISPRISEVLRDKRLCRLKQLLNEAGHEDTGLVEDITRGFDLTGALPRSGVFHQKFRPASMTCEDLRNVLNLSRSVLLESVQSSGDEEIDLGLFSATLKEVEKGFIQGPIDKEDLPAGSTLTKRFPVKQKNKVRPIDDYKASLVNFAVTQNEGVTIHTIDHIASMIAFLMGSGSLSASDGLVAKCWDLSDAYKQVPFLMKPSILTHTWQCTTLNAHQQRYSSNAFCLLGP